MPSLQQWLFSMVCVAVWLAWSAPTLATSCERTEVAYAWLTAALVSSLFGLVQYFGLAQHFDPWVNFSAPGEAYANLRQRNQFATLTSMGAAALLWWSVQAKGARAGKLCVWGGWLAAVLLALGNAVSSSRTGLVQLALLTLLAIGWGLWRQPQQRRLLITVLLVYGIAALALPALVDHVPGSSGILARFQQVSPACSSRLTLWHNMVELISQRPWLGWGWGELDYAHFMTAYDGLRFCELLDNAHNLPLHLAVEFGLPLALLVSGLVVWLTWCARPWRETDSTRQLAWMVLAVILLHSMLEYPLWYGPFQMSLMLCIGLLWTRKSPTSQASVGTVGGAWLHVTALMSFAAIAYAAWDYHRVSQIYLPPEQRTAAYRDNTLEKIRGSWLFRDQVQFAEFTLTSLTLENAAQLNAMAHELLHFSPEARVVEKLIESALLLGRDDEAKVFTQRYRAAYPQAYAQWVKARAE